MSARLSLGTLSLVAIAIILACGGGGSTQPQPASTSTPDPKAASLAAFANAQPALTGAITSAERAVVARDGKGALEAIAPVREQLVAFEAQPGASSMAGLSERFHTTQEAANRLVAVEEGLTLARDVVKDKDRCDTGLEVAKAWEGIKTVRADEPERKEAAALTAKLEKCRARIEKELTAGLKSVMAKQRVDMAAQMETTFLDQGMDMRVTVSGSNKDQIKMSWVLMSRVVAHQLTDGGSLAEGSFLGNLQRIGFRAVVFSDSYSESWTYTLHPPDESAFGRQALEPMGLGAPLALPG